MEETLSFAEFSNRLASKAPTPGGGGAAAAVGALSCALGQMVCNLTRGKERYAAVENEVEELLNTLQRARVRMLELVDEDAEAFRPLSRAYGIPKDDSSRASVMEQALLRACEPPMRIMELAAAVIEYLERLAQIGSRLALSDVGVAAVFAKAALEGASLNIYINAGSMTDADKSTELTERSDEIISTYGARAQQLFDSLVNDLKG